MELVIYLRFFFVTILILYTRLLLAQNVSGGLMLSTDSDTSYYYLHKERIDFFQLDDIWYVENEFVFRLWNTSYVLVIEKENGEISANIQFSVSKQRKKSLPKIFSKKYLLEAEKAEKLYNFILGNAVLEIPSDKFVSDWKQGFDGYDYTIELKSDTIYSIKSYWSPSIQQNLVQARELIDFVHQLEIISDLEHFADNFSTEIPFRAYKYFGTSYSIIRVESSK